MPQLIQNQVDARLAWQEPKAVITTLLLVLFAALSVVVAQRHQAVAGRATSGRSGAGRVGDHAGVFPLILMVAGNTQASYAPITMTLLFG